MIDHDEERQTDLGIISCVPYHALPSYVQRSWLSPRLAYQNENNKYIVWKTHNDSESTGIAHFIDRVIVSNKCEIVMTEKVHLCIRWNQKFSWSYVRTSYDWDADKTQYACVYAPIKEKFARTVVERLLLHLC